MASPVPRILSISPPDPAGVEAWVASAPSLASIPNLGLLLRALRADERAVRGWVGALEAAGVTVILHARTPGAARMALERGWGLHLPASADPAVWRSRQPGLLGLSCHSRTDLERAQGFCDYATLSPIYPPLSKPSDRRRPLGIERLAAALAGLSIPVLALGGLGAERVVPCVAAGAWGVAGIGVFSEPQALMAMARALRREG